MSEAIAYCDSSALAKLVVEEPESDALMGALSSRPVQVSSNLTRVELTRMVRRHAPDRAAAAALVLARVSLIRIDADVLGRAERLDPVELRALDAIHVATALALGDDLDVLISYDRRMLEAANAAGIEVLAPA